MRYLFDALVLAVSRNITTRLKGIPGYCVQSADFAHICHLQAVLRC